MGNFEQKLKKAILKDLQDIKSHREIQKDLFDAQADLKKAEKAFEESSKGRSWHMITAGEMYHDFVEEVRKEYKNE